MPNLALFKDTNCTNQTFQSPDVVRERPLNDAFELPDRVQKCFFFFVYSERLSAIYVFLKMLFPILETSIVIIYVRPNL